MVRIGTGKVSKLLIHQYLLVGILLVLTGWRLLIGSWSVSLEILWWWLGAVLGFVFVFADRVIYALLQEPEATLSIKMKDLFAQGRIYKGLAVVLLEREEQRNLVIRSVLFLGVWLVLALLTLTSTSGMLGRGFMLGLGLHLAFDLMADYLGKGKDVRHWFWQIKREFSQNEITTVVWGFMILFVLIALGL